MDQDETPERQLNIHFTPEEMAGHYANFANVSHSDYEFTMRARRRGYRLASDPAVRLWSDQSTSGDRDTGADSLRDFLGRCFSPRFVSNPLYWSSFILLACPVRWILPAQAGGMLGAPVGGLIRIDYMLVVHPSVKVNTVQELLTLVRAEPGKITFASSGAGTSSAQYWPRL